MTPINTFVTSLSRLPKGEHAVLFRLDMPKVSVNRLLSLGFTPGVEIAMLQNYGRGPLVVNVRGTYVAVGRGEAAGILVDRRQP